MCNVQQHEHYIELGNILVDSQARMSIVHLDNSYNDYNFSIFPKNLPRDQNTNELILGSRLGPKWQADLLEKKNNELEKKEERKN